MTANTHALSTSASVIDDSTANFLKIDLTASNAPSTGLYVDGQTTNHGVSTLSPGIFTASSGQVQVFLKAPNTLAPGTYTDTVTLEVCTDKACSSQVIGSPISVSVSYTVTAVSGSNAPTLSVGPNSPLSIHLLPTDPAPVAGAYYVGASVTNAPSYALTAKLTSTTNALQSTPTLSLNLDPNNLQAGDANLAFKSPAALGPGLYTDTITISVCLDAGCVNPLAGSPVTIPVSYLIGNGVPGSSGDTVVQLQLHAHDLVWDSARSVIYASVAADSTTSPNTIAVINPASGTVTSTVPLGGEAGNLAISDDGSYLYATALNTSQVWRLALPSLALDATVDLGGGFYAFDLQVAPGSPKTVGISRALTPAGLHGADGGLVIYDDLTMRTDVAGYGSQGETAELSFLAWASTASTLYAASGSTGQLSTLGVTAAGPQISASANVTTGGRIHDVNGLLFTDAGAVYNPTTAQVVGTLPIPAGFNTGSLSVALDATVPRIYSLGQGGSGTTLYIFDQSSLALLRTQDILKATVSVYSESPTPMIRWGTNGIAYASYDGQIVLISGPYLTN